MPEARVIGGYACRLLAPVVIFGLWLEAPVKAGDNCDANVRAVTALVSASQANGQTAEIAGLSEAVDALKAHCSADVTTSAQDVLDKQALLAKRQQALEEAKASRNTLLVARWEQEVIQSQSDLAEAIGRLRR